jgi:DNA gyrase/topoisomerase IV subunit A
VSLLSYTQYSQAFRVDAAICNTAKLRTTLKNEINNILSARGMNLPKEALSSEKQLNEIVALPLDALVQVELRILVEQIRSLNKSIAELEKTIAEEASKLEGHPSLRTSKRFETTRFPVQHK